MVGSYGTGLVSAGPRGKTAVLLPGRLEQLPDGRQRLAEIYPERFLDRGLEVRAEIGRVGGERGVGRDRVRRLEVHAGEIPHRGSQHEGTVHADRQAAVELLPFRV